MSGIAIPAARVAPEPRRALPGPIRVEAGTSIGGFSTRSKGDILYNLVITLIAAALLAAVVATGAYYGASTLTAQHHATVAHALVDQARQIYAASALYAQEHGGRWPESVAQLKGKYMQFIPQPPAEALAAREPSFWPVAHAETFGFDWEMVNDPTTHRQLYLRLKEALRAGVCQAVADMSQDREAGEGEVGSMLDPRRIIQCVAGGEGWTEPTFVWVTPGGGSHGAVCGAAIDRGEACRYRADGTLSPEAVAAAGQRPAEVVLRPPSGAKLMRMEGSNLLFANTPYPTPTWHDPSVADVELVGQAIEYPLDWGIQGVPTPLGWSDAFDPIPPGKVKAGKTGRSSYAAEVYATLEDAKSATVGMCRGQSADIYEYEVDCDGNVTAYTVTCRPSGKSGASLLQMEMACTEPGYAADAPATETCAAPYSTGAGNDKRVYTGILRTCVLTDADSVHYPQDGRCQMRLLSSGEYEPYAQDPDCGSRTGRPGCPLPAVTFDGSLLHIDFGKNGELESCAPQALSGCTRGGDGTWAC